MMIISEQTAEVAERLNLKIRQAGTPNTKFIPARKPTNVSQNIN
jgi:hypothetical protein